MESKFLCLPFVKIMGKLFSRMKKSQVRKKEKSKLTNRICSGDCCKESNRRGNKKLDEKTIMRHFGYKIFNTIGRGAYAVVKEGHSDHINKAVAIKIFDYGKLPQCVKNKFLPRELKITYHMNHQNIVKCHEIMKLRDKIYVVLEMMGKGDLLSFVQNQHCIEESSAKKLSKGIISAVKYLHSKKIAHRDLKLENILLDYNFVPKLSDFGFARHFDSRSLSHTFCGSPAYAPIEVLSGTPYNPFMVDVWSLGVVIYAMTVGYLPFNDTQQVDKMKTGVKFIDAKQNLSFALKDLILKILVSEPEERLSLVDILQHEWFMND